MRISPTDKLIQLAAKRQIIRTKDASELGVPRNYLGRLVRKGILEKVRRGLYTSPKFSGNEHLTLIEAAYQLPKGIVCLLSAVCRPPSAFTISLRSLPMKSGWPSDKGPGHPRFPHLRFALFACLARPFILA